MFIWAALSAEDSLINLKKEIKRIEKEINFNESKLTLPLHISLRMSFEINDSLYPIVIKDLESFLKSINPFDVNTSKIELHETISWLKMEENETLNKIHSSLCEMLLNKYNIALLEYDKDFVFHTTLFLDSDKELVKSGFLKIKDIEYPKTINISKAIIGESKSGEIGTYKVTKEINL